MRNSWTNAVERPPQAVDGRLPELVEERPVEAADAALAVRLRNGEQRAFAELLERFEKTVFRFAYGFFRDREDAMEIVQETFLRVYRKIGHYEPSHSLGSWIMRISYHLCIDQYRRQKRQARWNEPLDDVRHQPPSNEELPEERLLAQTVQAEIEYAMESLSDKQRAVFVLRHGQGLKLDEIAGALGISTGTVKTLHHRALKTIRRVIAARET